MLKSHRSQTLIIAFVLAGLSFVATASEEFIITPAEIQLDEHQIVRLYSADGKCAYSGSLSAVAYEPTGVLERVADFVMTSFGEEKQKDWTLSVDRHQCSDIVETVSGTVHLGVLTNPIPARTRLKASFQPG